jgi:hypothetical protein
MNPAQITTVAELRNAVISYLEQHDVTDDDVNLFIFLAERDFEDELVLDQKEALDSGNLVNGQQTYALPGGFEEPIIFYLTDQRNARIEQVATSWFFDAPISSQQGFPRYYTIVGTEYFLGPIPDSTHAYRFYYYARPADLSDANTSNVILASYPDLYLYKCLAKGSQFFQDDVGLQRWMALYEGTKDRIHGAQLRKKSRPQLRSRADMTDDNAWSPTR